jgi:hypothetical protein
VKKLESIAFAFLCLLVFLCAGAAWFNLMGMVFGATGYEVRGLMFGRLPALLLMLLLVIPPLVLAGALWRRHNTARWCAVAVFAFSLGSLLALPPADSPFYSTAQIVLYRSIMAVPIILAVLYLLLRFKPRS